MLINHSTSNNCLRSTRISPCTSPTMSSLTSPPSSLSTFSPTAQIRVSYPQRRRRAHYKSAYVLVSGRVYWKETKKGAIDQPQSLLGFRNTNSLELVRLRDGSWKDVDEEVMVDSQEGRPRITVRGHLHGHKLFLVRDVRIEIIADTSDQHEVLVQRIRARFAPWNLLLQQARGAFNGGPSSGVEEFVKGVDGFGISSVSTTRPLCRRIKSKNGVIFLCTFLNRFKN